MAVVTFVAEDISVAFGVAPRCTVEVVDQVAFHKHLVQRVERKEALNEGRHQVGLAAT